MTHDHINLDLHEETGITFLLWMPQWWEWRYKSESPWPQLWYRRQTLQVSRGIASTSGRAQLAWRTQVLPGQPRPGWRGRCWWWSSCTRSSWSLCRSPCCQEHPEKGIDHRYMTMEWECCTPGAAPRVSVWCMHPRRSNPFQNPQLKSPKKIFQYHQWQTTRRGLERLIFPRSLDG